MFRIKNNRLEPTGPNPLRLGGILKAYNDDESVPFNQLVSYVAEQLSAISLPTNATLTTTNATQTTIATIPVPTSTSLYIDARVVARRTGGSAGSAGDSAAYTISATYKNIAGSVSEVGEASVFAAEDQSGWNCTAVVSGTNILIQVVGATNNTVNWSVTYNVYSVS